MHNKIKVIFQAVRAAINRQLGSERSRGINPREVCESGKFNIYGGQLS